MSDDDYRRAVPRTDRVIADARLSGAIDRLGAAAVKTAVREAQQRVRIGELDPSVLVDMVLRRLPPRATSLRRVINATGVVLHTNLGRAPLSDAALDAIGAAAAYVDVEYDVETGTRARRGRGALSAMRAAVPAAEDVLVVNNGAAALVLATTALAAGHEVVVSRGEMVEIGDGFRLPDLIESTGAQLREVGTTNRTNLDDYQRAVGADTGCVLKVHPSNFRIEGFTDSVGSELLATLDPPLVVDVGSGLLAPERMLPDEPDVTSVLQAGADLVTCSGDKLLGGPQAGLVFGRSATVERLRRHPMARAMRVDKLTLAALEATLTGPTPPVWSSLKIDDRDLLRRSRALAAQTGGEVIIGDGTVGGGSAPGRRLPGWAVAMDYSLGESLRRGDPPVIGRVEKDRCLLDLRCVATEDDATVRDAVLACMS